MWTLSQRVPRSGPSRRENALCDLLRTSWLDSWENTRDSPAAQASPGPVASRSTPSQAILPYALLLAAYPGPADPPSRFAGSRCGGLLRPLFLW